MHHRQPGKGRLSLLRQGRVQGAAGLACRNGSIGEHQSQGGYFAFTKAEFKGLGYHCASPPRQLGLGAHWLGLLDSSLCYRLFWHGSSFQ